MKKVKYYYSKPVHIRTIPVVTDANGDPIYILGSKPLKVKSLPRVIVASVWDTSLNEMRFGVSICHPKDIFVKEIGRKIALKRALESPQISVRITKRNSTHSVSKRHAEQLIETFLEKYVQSNL